MRLQVKYPDGQPHEVELLGRVSIIGRDPSCDLVVHDVKCSRRHAVLETGPDGVTVRDSGSANGVFVNGQRIERAILRPGDVVSMGEVQISLIPENVAGGADATFVPGAAGFPTALPGMVPSPLGAPPLPPPAPAPMAAPRAPANSQQTTRPAPPPPPPRPPLPGGAPTAELPRPTGSYRLSGSTDSGKVKVEQVEEEMEAAARAEGASQRPLTVTVLAALWMASVLLYLGTAVVGLVRTGGLFGIITAVICGFMVLVSGVMALGLWKVAPWARIAQIVIAGVGVLTCTFSLPSIATIVYFLRPAVRARFATGEGPGDPKEGLFTGLILGTVVLGVLAGLGVSLLGSLGSAGARIP